MTDIVKPPHRQLRMGRPPSVDQLVGVVSVRRLVQMGVRLSLMSKSATQASPLKKEGSQTLARPAVPSMPELMAPS